MSNNNNNINNNDSKQKEQTAKNHISFNEKVAFIFILMGVIIILVTIFTNIFGVTRENLPERFNDLGQFFEGTVGALWSLAGIMLFYAALKYQKDELKLQREQVRQQLVEFRQQTKQAKKRNVTLEMQKFETTFFQMMEFQNEIVKSIEMEVNKFGLPSHDDPSQNIKITGRHCFVEYFKNYKIYFNSYLEDYMSGDITPDVTMELIERSYDAFFEEYQSDLGHYFRNIWNIVKFIDSRDFKFTKFYIDLLRAQLTNYELLLLFFHCLSKLGIEFKPLVEKYSLLQNLPDDEIIMLTKEMYAPLAFGEEEEEDEEIV